MKCTTISLLVLLILLLASFTCRAQRTAETAEGIKRELDGIKTEFVATLQSAASNPENLQSHGQTEVNCEQILAKLESLQSRINGTADVLAKREADLSVKAGLSEADKLELKQALQTQRKPLDAHKKTATQLQSELKSLITTKIGAIYEIYKNYLDISGPEQAKAKVVANIQPLLAPYLPPKTKPPQTTTELNSKEKFMVTPQSKQQSDIEIVKAENAELLKVLNEARSSTPAPQLGDNYTVAYKGNDGVSIRSTPSGPIIATAYYGPDTCMTVVSDSAINADGLTWVQIKVSGWMAKRNLQNGYINITPIAEGRSVVTWDGGGDPNDNFIAMKTLGSKGKRIAKVYHRTEIELNESTISGNYEWAKADLTGWVPVRGPKGSTLIEPTKQ